MFSRRASATAIVALSIGGCSGSPTAPRSDPSPSPPIVVNTPPTISEMRTSSPRVDADQEVEVTAFVKDAETPLDQLVYTWSASPVNGTFTGNGPLVKWRAPRQQKTPDSYTLTLTITESYTSAGLPQTNKVSSSVTMHYNDSFSEVNSIATQFLTDFGTFSVSPEQCVRNFSDSCRGKLDELSDIRNNRATVHILSSSFTATDISFDAGKAAGTIQGPCTFHDIDNATGQRRAVSGVCRMTTVYENWRWWLCVSNFLDGTSTPEGLLRYRVPGRIIQLRFIP